MEDEELEVTVAVTLQGNVDAADLDDNVTVAVDSVRYLDADNVPETDSATGDLGDTVSFDLQEKGTDDELVVKTNSSDPDASTIKVMRLMLNQTG